LDSREKVGVLVHEYLHVLLQHCTTRMKHKTGAKALKENFAMDMAINQVIERVWTLPYFAIRPDKAPFNYPLGLTAEQYFALIDKDYTDEEFEDQFGSDDTLDDHSGWEEAGPEDKAAIKEMAKAYANSSKANRKGTTLTQGGNALGNVLERLLAIEVNDISWIAVTRYFLSKTITNVRLRTYKRPSRRYGFPNPGSKFKRTTKAAVIIDTSASMDNGYLQYIGGHLNMMTSIMQIDVLMCDITVRSEIKKYRPTSELDYTGRGGTDLRPAFKHAEKEGYKAIICFTDGGLLSEVQSNLPTLWVCVNNESFKPSFGNVCHVEWNED
jgi:predicted metal-dependent peptidase